ncbi:hypothetical protein ACA910_006539 [Epithemia clementina (nom. ined.)]
MTFYCRGAKLPEVLSLMFRLHQILIKGYLFIHIIWVAGKRMIAQGSDGLSRLDLANGVMQGINMLKYMPLHLTAERQGIQIRWFIKSITQELSMPWQYLSPDE